MTLSDYDKKILAVLDTDGGFATGDVAKKVMPQFGRSVHAHSGAVRRWLIVLEGKGLVRKLDNDKPVCWVKTAAGVAIS